MPLDANGNHVPDQAWIDSVNAVARPMPDNTSGDPEEKTLAMALAEADERGRHESS